MRGARVAALGGALILAGCAVGPAPSDHFYRLEVPSPAHSLATAPFDGSLEVDRIRIDALTGERGLVYRIPEEGSQLRRHAYHRWADPPALMVQRQLVGYLRKAGAASSVFTPDLRLRADYVLLGRIVRLERVVGNADVHAVVELELAVRRERDQRLVFEGAYLEERAVPSRKPGRSVRAYNEALASIFERFLEEASGVMAAWSPGDALR